MGRLDDAPQVHVESAAQWDAYPPSVRRALLEWVVQAKRQGTRDKRVTEIAEKAARGDRANQWPR